MVLKKSFFVTKIKQGHSKNFLLFTQLSLWMVNFCPKSDIFCLFSPYIYMCGSGSNTDPNPQPCVLLLLLLVIYTLQYE